MRNTPNRARRAGLWIAGSLAVLCSVPGAAVGAPKPPDGRGYELVSPVDKNGTSVASVLRTSADGKGVAWTAQGAYGDDIRGSNATVPYAARRTAAGWSTTPFHPRFTADVRPDLLTPLGAWTFPDDLSSMTFISSGAFLPEDGDNYPGLPFGPIDVYRVDGHGNSTLLSHGEGVPGNGFGPANISGISDDGATAFFNSSDPLTATVPPTSTQIQLYRWRGGRVDEVGYDPSGTFLDGGSWLGAGVSYLPAGSGQLGEAADSLALSGDGRRFVFGGSLTNGSARQVYLHIDGAPTRQLSLSQRTGTRGDPSASNAYFLTATPNLAKIYFQSNDQLSNDAPVGGGLYVYDVADEQLNFSNPDQSPYVDPNTVGSEGLTQVSDDGAYVYFVSPLDLAAGATVGARNLYALHDRVTTFIGAVPETDDGLASSPLPDFLSFSPVYTSTGLDVSGTKLVFASTASLAGVDANGHSVVYLYDAVGRTLSCISCRASGGQSQGNSMLRVADGDGLLRTPTVISRDGRTIMFTSADDLLPQDINGVEDVYEWHDGRLMLVSGGEAGQISSAVGMGKDGADIFFKTTQSLVARDIDGGLADVYDARIGGGEPEVHEPPVCRDDECQGSPAPRASQETPGSAQVSGSGQDDDARVSVKPVLRVPVLSAVQLRGFARSGGLVLDVRATVAGRVDVTLRSKLGRHTAKVASASRAAKTGGTVKVPLKLSGAARSTLARSGTLRITMSVSHSTVAGTQTRVFTLHALSSTNPGGKR